MHFYDLPTYLFPYKKIILIIILKRYYLNNLISQMVHCSIVKMIGQMVFTLLIKNTTPITLDMLKLICPKWKGVFLAHIQIWFFLPKFPIWKIKNFSSDAIIYKNGQYYEIRISIKLDINIGISFSFSEVDVKKESIKNIKPFIPSFEKIISNYRWISTICKPCCANWEVLNLLVFPYKCPHARWNLNMLF
jgi:hypothetical protein